MLNPKEFQTYLNLFNTKNQIELHHDYQETEDPRILNYLIEINMGLVRNMAIKFSNWYTNVSLEREDYENEAVFGLRRAVEMYDPDSGYTFSTYAFHWIRQTMTRAVQNQGGVVRTPVHVYEMKREVAKAHTKLSDDLERDPTRQELAQYLSNKPSFCKENGLVQRVRTSLKNKKGRNPRPKDIEEAILEGGYLEYVPRSGDPGISVDSPLKPGQDATILDFRWDDNGKEERKNLTDVVRVAMNVLNPREQYIVAWRWGIKHNGEQTTDHTLGEIGDELELTRERVRQILAKAYEKMKPFLETEGYTSL